MIGDDIILKAFLHGATIESLWIITGQDVESAIRRELLKRAQAHERQQDAPPGRQARKGRANRADERGDDTPPRGQHGPAIVLPPKTPAQERRKPQPVAAAKQSGSDETFTDLLITTIESLGEPTLAEIDADLAASDVRKTRDQISGKLNYLKKVGRIERIGEGHTGRWRVVR